MKPNSTSGTPTTRRDGIRRPVLLTIAALGGLVCLIGGTGLFAALTDTARTGTNSVESAALAASADIQLATADASGNTFACDAFSEDLSTAFITVSDFEPGEASVARAYCIRNVGSQQVTLSALADELTDVDFACTGDESLHGDSTCGSDQAGELSSVLQVSHRLLDCNDTGAGPATATNLDGNDTFGIDLGTIAAGATRCFTAQVRYLTTTPVADVQKAQSDRSTWRFKFTAQA